MEKIKVLRQSAGLKQKELAEKVGIKTSTVAMWESGKSNPRTAMLPQLAEVLGVTVDELLRE